MIPDGNNRVQEISRHCIDIEEQFFANTYQHLVEFVTDFQMNRSGRPTKRMAAELAGMPSSFLNVRQRGAYEMASFIRHQLVIRLGERLLVNSG